MKSYSKLKRATILLIALTFSIIYTIAITLCTILIRNNSTILSGSISSQNESTYSDVSSHNSANSDTTSSTDSSNSSHLVSSYLSSSEITSSDISSSHIISSDTGSSKDSSISSTSSEFNSSAVSITTSSIGSNSSNQIVTPQNKSFSSAIWYSYIDFDFKGCSKAVFEQRINKMFDDAVNLGCDAVICHVRPFADSLYYSQFFPMSHILSGTQGVDPGYDALEYMVKAAHKRSLEIHAWLNPYRITSNSTDINTLSKNHPAYKWRNDSVTSNDRYVLSWGDKLYLNPAELEVQKLIIDGAREIAQNYDVDGIHIDDYFYPTTDTNFDKIEYQKYTSDGGKLSLGDWRRNNVNSLVSGLYKAIKTINRDIEFGVSPSYHISNNQTDLNYKESYADLKKWMTNSGYIDYIAPQIYFGYNHPTAAYTKILNLWLSIPRLKNIDIFIGLAAYKIGTVDANTIEWQTQKDILAQQTLDAKAKGCNGVFIFAYSDIMKNNNLTNSQRQNLIDAIKKCK